MSQPADRRDLQRWAFLCFGWLLILGDRQVADYGLRAHDWARLLFPEDILRQARAVAAVHLFVVLCGLLCLVTAAGLKRGRGWSRWFGILTCTVLLAGFPLLTVAGATGLFVLIAKPPQLGKGSSRTKDYWADKRQSFLQPVISGILLFVSFGFVGWLALEAKRSGMHAYQGSQAGWWLMLLGSFLVQTALHEFGHAIVAWALHSEVKVISIGPFLFVRERHWVEFQFNWKRLLDSGGFMGAVPASEKSLRLQQIAIVAAGPAASLLTGLVLLAGFYSMAAAHWQGDWRLVAFNSVIGFYYAVANLIPVGYSDGSMIFHLVFGTQAGRQLLSGLAVQRIQEDASECHDRADFEKEVALRELAVQRISKERPGKTVVLAMAHQRLGHTRTSLGDWAGAAAAFRRCLEFEAECAAHPEVAGGAWAGLQLAAVGRHAVDDARRAYTSALTALDAAKRKHPRRASVGGKSAVLAGVHQRAGHWEVALDESKDSLRKLPSHPRYLLLRAIVVGNQAQCELCLDGLDAGLAAARRAAELLRSEKLPAARRNLAWSELGHVGEKLWQAGQSAAAVDLMREAIERLEAGGAAAAAARWRIKLAGVLRQLGRLEEAERLLPDEAALTGFSLRLLLAERAHLHLSRGRPEEAAEDAQELLALWSEVADAAIETAVARSLLAKACLEAGACEQADVQARKAGEVLETSQHPDALSCRITHMLARGSDAREEATTVADEVLRLIQADPLLLPADKARFLETEASRLERHGHSGGAQVLRGAVPAQWRLLGMESPAALAEIAP